MSKILQLIKKDFVVDWRQQNPFSGILLYLASTIFASFMAFNKMITSEVWNALFWIILLFTSINAISKSFIQEERRTHYYFFSCKPSEIISAKLLYSSCYLLTIGLASLFIYSVFFGNPIESYLLFLLNFVFGCIGLASGFTMISAISFRSTNRPIMMAILGFPVIIPVLLLSISNASKIIDGYIWMQIRGNMVSLLSVDVIILALSFVLFPFIWKS